MEKAALGTFLLGAAVGTFTTLRLKRYAQTKGLPKKIKRSQGEYYAYDTTRDKFYKIEPIEFKELIASDNYSEAPDQKAGETIYTLKILKKGGEVADKIPGSTKIQTLIFDKAKYSKGDARTWAYEHGFRHRNLDETENTYRIRQATPENFNKDSFRTIELKEGIKATIAKPIEMAKGGEVIDAKTQEQINKLEKAIASPATPDNFKEHMKKQLAVLKTRKPVIPAEKTEKTEKQKQEKIKEALKELELSAENIEQCQKVINEHRKLQREAAGPQPKKKRITLFKEKMESITGFLSKQVKEDEKAQTKIKNLTEKYIINIGLVLFGSDAKTLNPAKVKEMVEEKFAKMEGGGSVVLGFLEIQEKINELKFKPDTYVVLVKEDAYDNSGNPFYLDSHSFTDINEAFDKYQKELTHIRTMYASENPDYKQIELQAWDEDMYDMEILAEETYNVSYEDDFGKLVIQYQHVGKGMNYAHKFIGLFFLDKYSEKNISNNPDKRFSTWTNILDLKKEDFTGLTKEQAIELIEKEANLKLQNNISLDDIEREIDLKEEEEIED